MIERGAQQPDPRSVHSPGDAVQHRERDHRCRRAADDRRCRGAGAGRHDARRRLRRWHRRLRLRPACTPGDRHRHDPGDARPRPPIGGRKGYRQRHLARGRRRLAALARRIFHDRRDPFCRAPLSRSLGGVARDGAGMRARGLHRRGRHLRLVRPGQGRRCSTGWKNCAIPRMSAPCRSPNCTACIAPPACAEPQTQFYELRD